MEEQWFITRKGADFQGIANRFKISPIIALLMRNREIIGDEAIDMYLNGTLEHLHDGILMKDMSKAIDILREKIQSRKRIRIIGDYDIDGVSATYILLEGLENLGACVDSDIPDRIKDGYGLNIELIERAIADDIDTIITCDNGIAAANEIAYAKEQGLTIIITDHHEVPYEEVATIDGFERQYILPSADAVIDPKQEDCTYPFKELCGAAVAYKLIEALHHAMGRDAEDVDYLMENVAIATIGDVMELIEENRIFVKQGLEMLKRTKNLGLQALIEKTQIDVENLGSYHIGFVLGPCLNASGRLDTAKKALQLMRSKRKKDADIMASDLKALNDSRKEMTFAGVDQAIELIESMYLDDPVLVVYLSDCHESLAGIIAGRIREKYNKPAIVLTQAEDGVKGSGRSIEAYHMYEELSKCKELFRRYGGHKLAAGMSLLEENVDKLRRTLNLLCTLSKDDLMPKISIDMQCPLSYISEGMIQELSRLEPFGKGNAKPVFVEKGLEIIKLQIIGKNQNVIKMQVIDLQGIEMSAIYFGDVLKFMEYLEITFSKSAIEAIKKGRRANIQMSFTFYPSINEYMNQKTLQIIVQNYR